MSFLIQYFYSYLVKAMSIRYLLFELAKVKVRLQLKGYKDLNLKFFYLIPSISVTELLYCHFLINICIFELFIC